MFSNSVPVPGTWCDNIPVGSIYNRRYTRRLHETRVEVGLTGSPVFIGNSLFDRRLQVMIPSSGALFCFVFVSGNSPVWICTRAEQADESRTKKISPLVSTVLEALFYSTTYSTLHVPNLSTSYPGFGFAEMLSGAPSFT